MSERLFSWVTPIPGSAVEKLEKALEDINADPEGNKWLPFGRLPMVHFASLTLFPEGQDGAATLVFENNVDRPAGAYVKTLVDVGRQGLDRIYAGCDGYPGPEGGPEAIAAFLGRQKKKPQLFHIGHPYRSVQDIRGDFELRRSIKHELDSHRALRDQSPSDILAQVRRKANCPSALLPLRRPWHPDWDGPNPAPTPLSEIQWRRGQLAWEKIFHLVRLFGLHMLGVIVAVSL